MLEQIKEITKTFFDKMWIKSYLLEVVEEIQNTYLIKIETNDSWLLIWTHWVVFEAIQNILRSILNNKFDKKIKVHLEINDYIHNKDAKLFRFIDTQIQKAKETWRNMKLPKFSAYERKKIHDYVASLQDDEIKTESKGEGQQRRLYIILLKNINKSPKKISLSIDIDWDDI